MAVVTRLDWVALAAGVFSLSVLLIQQRWAVAAVIGLFLAVQVHNLLGRRR